MKHSYHIEYDLPLEYEGDFMKVIETLADYMDYIMDDILQDLGIERHKLIFYYLVHKLILNRIIKLEQRETCSRVLQFWIMGACRLSPPTGFKIISCPNSDSEVLDFNYDGLMNRIRIRTREVDPW